MLHETWGWCKYKNWLKWVMVTPWLSCWCTVAPSTLCQSLHRYRIKLLQQTMIKNTVKFHTPTRQIRCTVAQISPLPGCDWWPTSSLIVAAYRAGRGAAGVVHSERQPWDNSCTGGRKSQQSEQEKFKQGEARWGPKLFVQDDICARRYPRSCTPPTCRSDSATSWFSLQLSRSCVWRAS